MAEGINLLTYYLQPPPAYHRLIVLVPPYVYTRPRLTRHHSRAAPGIQCQPVAGSLKPGMPVSILPRPGALGGILHDHHLSVYR